MKIIIVLCYGLYQNQKNYKNYLDNVLKIIALESPDRIIICGGYTSKSHPDISEAQSVSDYLLTRNPQIKDRLVLENQSITTLQNIKFASDELAKLGSKTDSVIFVCDSIRLTKVYYIGVLLVGKALGIQIDKEKILLNLMHQVQNAKIDFTKDCQLNFGNIIFRGIDMGRSLSEVGDQIPRTLTEIFSLEFPKLEEEALDCRSKDWNLENS